MAVPLPLTLLLLATLLDTVGVKEGLWLTHTLALCVATAAEGEAKEVRDAEGVAAKEPFPVRLNVGLIAVEGEKARETLAIPEAVLHA